MQSWLNHLDMPSKPLEHTLIALFDLLVGVVDAEAEDTGYPRPEEPTPLAEAVLTAGIGAHFLVTLNQGDLQWFWS